MAVLSRQSSVAERYERWFGPAFAAWLRDVFHGSAPVVAQVFGVTPRCAENWLAGRAVPRGELVAFALTHSEFGASAREALTWREAA